MTSLTFKGTPVHTEGVFPAVGTAAKNFTLVKGDLSEASLADYKGKKKLLNIFVSLDTGICASSVKKFAEQVHTLKDVVTLNISKDLPFAQARFCSAEKVNGVETLSAFRSSFAKDYGLEMADGPLKGLCSRAVIVLDEHDHIVYCEQLSEIAQEPNYTKALEALRKTG